MASSYPGSLDAFTNPASTDAMDASAALYHDVQHANINDAVEAVQAELGTDPAGAFPTVKARLMTIPAGVYGAAGDWYTGCLYWTIDPFFGNSGVATSSQELVLNRWACPASFTATKMWWVQNSVASTITAAYVGIYDSSGTLLTSATTTSAIGSAGLKSATITSQSVSAGSVYYLAMLVNASTAGSVVGTGNIGSTICARMGASSSDRPFYTLAAQTSLPASVTLSSLTVSGLPRLFGVSE